MAMLALLSAVLTCGAIGYARARKLYDLPGERRSHTIATARGGGIAIVLVALTALAVAAVQLPQWRGHIAVFGLGLLAVAGIGWWDDHRPLSARVRLYVHVGASLLLAGLALRITQSPLIALCGFALSVCLINVWNFMDGINGIAASQAALVGVGFALLLPWPLSLPGWVLAAACLGFLPFNFPRARIFMGDVGSGALGYLVAGVWVFTAAHMQNSLVALALPLVAFLGDAGLTLLRRVWAGERITQAHAQHLYQRLTQCGCSHAFVTTAYFVFTLLAIFFMHYLSDNSLLVQLGGFSVFSLAAIACWTWLAKGVRR